MSEIEKTEGRYLEAKFGATFQNAISTLERKEALTSKTFIFCDIPWNISFETYSSIGNRDMSCYLNCLETKPGFSCTVSYKFSAMSASGMHLKKQDTTTFNENVGTGCIDYAFPVSKLSNPSEGFIFDGALTMHVELTFKYQDGKEKLILSLQPSTTNDLIKDMNVLLESGDGDVTFKLKDGVIIKAHKNILCVRNAVFAKMLSVDMKEAKTNEVVIDDMGKSALKALLQHIYTGLCMFPEGLDVDSCKEVVNAAEKYNLPELKEVAGMGLAGFCNPTNALQLFTFCRDRNVTEATKTLATYIKKNADQVLEKLEFCGCNI